MSLPDPVADKSTFLCMYMSNHPDTLVAYVRYWGKVGEAVESARMTAIDSKVCRRACVLLSSRKADETMTFTSSWALMVLALKGMTLSYNLKGAGSGAKKEVRVVFDPPLAGYEEVKPRLMTMTAVAQEELGMVRLLSSHIPWLVQDKLNTPEHAHATGKSTPNHHLPHHEPPPRLRHRSPDPCTLLHHIRPLSPGFLGARMAARPDDPRTYASARHPDHMGRGADDTHARITVHGQPVQET